MRALCWPLLLCCALPVAAKAPAAGQPLSIDGQWLTDDRTAIVTIDRCGNHVCGTIAKILNPAAPRFDVNNPQRALRSRPLIGTPVLTDFVPSADQWRSGRAYDPKSGRSYRSTLQLEGNGTLKVTGCLLFMCQTRHWIRLR